MGTINPTIPTLGDPNSSEDSDVRSALITIRDAINGELDTNNLSGSASLTDEQLASPNNTVYRTLMTGANSLGGSAVEGTYFFNGGGSFGAGTLNVGAPGAIYGIYLNNLDYLVNNRTPKLRLRIHESTAAAGPATTLTFGLYPVTAISGGTYTVGTVLSGSTVAFASTAGNTLVEGNSGDFSFPTTGLYFVGLVISGGSTNGSSTHDISFQLQMRHVSG